MTNVFSCEQCGKTCKSAKSLKAHIRGVTCKIRVHSCLCGRDFDFNIGFPFQKIRSVVLISNNTEQLELQDRAQ